MKKFVTCIAALAVSCGILVYPASASEVKEQKMESENIKVEKERIIGEIKKSYKDEKVQKTLIKKTQKGEIFDADNPQKASQGKKQKLDQYTTLTTFPDGSQTLEGIDLSKAKFYDENGNEVTKDVKSDKIKTNSVQAAGVISGGTWSSGSGYSCVKGIKVFKQIIANYSAKFYADFCNNSGAYDKLSRVYGVDIEAGESWSILDQGVFRSNENGTYSAYGGVKYQAKARPDSNMVTRYLYLRVGNDKYWYQSNY
ncbi:hypothetical protein ACFU1R_29050 [Priestia megaterium]|uniref:hypothetical protein n=1 Tax=Priestia megaterium TaxID=1404 RepID=UPI00366C521A